MVPVINGLNGKRFKCACFLIYGGFISETPNVIDSDEVHIQKSHHHLDHLNDYSEIGLEF